VPNPKEALKGIMIGVSVVVVILLFFTLKYGIRSLRSKTPVEVLEL
jgi:hypothetical protein